MRKYLIPLAVVVIAAVVSPTAIMADDGNCMKFSLDPFALLGESDKERSGEDRPQKIDDRTDRERYTYDATGRKVPVSTE